MNHQDHVDLIKDAIIAKGGMWADLGSGKGAFALALRDLVGPESEIFSIDMNARDLKIQKERFKTLFSQSRIHFRETDFTQPLALPPLNGIVMANSLHFIKDKISLLSHLKMYLNDTGRLIIVEYNSDKGNAWVPYPTSDTTLSKLLLKAGFSHPRVLHRVPSEFLGEIYSIMAFNYR